MVSQWVQGRAKLLHPSAATAEHWIDADNPRLKSLETNGACWWTVFNDPTLDYLVTSAANENLTLKTAGCRILEARANAASLPAICFPSSNRWAAAIPATHWGTDIRSIYSTWGITTTT